MAVKIGGLTVKQCQQRWGVSRGTIHNYRKSPEWPGDEADIGLLDTHVNYKKSPQGRKPDVRAPFMGAAFATSTPAIDAGDGLNDETMDAASLLQALDLDREAKVALIEKSKAMTYEYQQRALAEYREEVGRQLGKALAELFQEIRAAELTEAQLDNLKKALDRIVQRLRLGKVRRDVQQPELLLELTTGDAGAGEEGAES